MKQICQNRLYLNGCYLGVVLFVVAILERTEQLIIMDGERNHNMGSSMDGTPPHSED